MIAYCWANGRIDFSSGRSAPEGAILICRGAARHVQNEITATTRHAYDGKTLLVPGIPEATNEEAAGDALELYLLWLKQREQCIRKGFRVAIKPHDPFDHVLCGQPCSILSATDRIRMVANFNMRQCLSALLVFGLQATVRAAIERRMRQLPIGVSP